MLDDSLLESGSREVKRLKKKRQPLGEYFIYHFPKVHCERERDFL